METILTNPYHDMMYSPIKSLKRAQRSKQP